MLFVTNNASKSRKQYAQKLNALGFEAEEREIYSSSYAAASYLKNLSFSKEVYIVGMSGIEEELQGVGIAFHGGSKTICKDISLDEVSFLEMKPQVGAVVVGLDLAFCYEKLALASAYLADPLCLFIATNPDHGMNASNGRFLPGAGSIVASIEKASNRKPTVVGKLELSFFFSRISSFVLLCFLILDLKENRVLCCLR